MLYNDIRNWRSKQADIESMVEIWVDKYIDPKKQMNNWAILNWKVKAVIYACEME